MTTLNNLLIHFSLLALPLGLHTVSSEGPEIPGKSGNPSVSDARKGKWIQLFDGKTKQGWHVFRNRTDGSNWKVVDGTLMYDPDEKKDGKRVGGGDLITDGVYENFHFSVEWKVAPKANSGIIFLLQDDAKYEHTWHTGPEMQVLDNDGHPDAKIPTHRAGNLYDMIAGPDDPVKPAGEWNRAEIILDKGRLELKMNGTTVVTTTMWDEAWKNMVAKSKFKTKPDFAVFHSGHIALQDHGDRVWFRDIKIKKL